METIGESTDNLHYTGLLNRLYCTHAMKNYRTYCTCFTEESRLLAAYHTENDQLSGLSSLLLVNSMETEYICLREILLELLEMYSKHVD